MCRVRELERDTGSDYIIRGVKIGGESRMKVLAEIMDAHRCEGIREMTERYFASGADIVDLGFGFDATPEDVKNVFSLLEGIDLPLAVDTQDPALIRAALERADIVLSLQERNIPRVGKEVGEAGAAAVIVPGASTLAKNIAMAKRAGVSCIIADPLLQPAGSGLVKSLKNFKKITLPALFWGRKCIRTPGCGLDRRQRHPCGDGNGGRSGSGLHQRAFGQDPGVHPRDAEGDGDDGPCP